MSLPLTKNPPALAGGRCQYLTQCPQWVLHVYFTRHGQRQHTDWSTYLSPETKASLPPLSRRVLNLANN